MSISALHHHRHIRHGQIAGGFNQTASAAPTANAAGPVNSTPATDVQSTQPATSTQSASIGSGSTTQVSANQPTSNTNSVDIKA
jgi:hypothetical protein